MISENEQFEHDDEFHQTTGKEKKLQAKAKIYPGYESQSYDQILSSIFHKVPPGEGDEFGAIKPWLGAIKEPTNHPPKNPAKPNQVHTIEWVYGYRNEETRQNCFFNANGCAVYPTAALGIIYDYKSMTQLYFGGGETDFAVRKQEDESKDGHSDDITALCMSFSRKIVASGQNGQKPQIFVWNALTAELIGKKRMPKGCRLVTAIGISKNDQYICATDAAEKVTAHIYSLAGGPDSIATVSINTKVTHLVWSPHADVISVVGKDQLMIVDFDGKVGKATRGKNKDQDKSCSHSAVTFINDAQFKDDMISAGSDGSLYHWQRDVCKNIVPNSQGILMSICSQTSQANGELVFVGGKDSSLNIYSFNGALKILLKINLQSYARSLDFLNETILIGQNNGSIYELPLSKAQTGQGQEIMKSHCEGEVWGLDKVHLPDGSIKLFTSCDDNRVIIYDVLSHKALLEFPVSKSNKVQKSAKKVDKKRGGASSMSKLSAEKQSRCVVYNVVMNQLAVANNQGLVTVYELDWVKINRGDVSGLIQKCTLLGDVKNGEWIETMVFSPDNHWLAIGSHDNNIYIFDTKTYTANKKLVLKGHSSFITQLDWSADSKWIRSVCGAYELLFFDVPGKTRKPGGASATVGVDWADQTCPFGWCVQGIYPEGTDGSHINTVCMSRDQKLIASGDDYGLLCVYRNPCLPGSKARMYRGHSEHVTQVIFSDCGKYLFSTGGQDQTTIQWRKHKE